MRVTGRSRFVTEKGILPALQIAVAAALLLTVTPLLDATVAAPLIAFAAMAALTAELGRRLVRDLEQAAAQGPALNRSQRLPDAG